VTGHSKTVEQRKVYSNELLKPIRSELQLIDISPSRSEEHRRLPGNSALQSYRLLLRRRKWTVVLFAATLFTLVGIDSYLMTPLYEATGRISVARENSDLLSSKEGSEDISGDNAEYNMYLDAQTRILSSDTLVLQAAKDLHWVEIRPPSGSTLQSETQLANKRETVLIEDIDKQLDVSRVPRTPIIEIKYSNADPQIAATFVNELMHAYVDQNFKTKYESATQVSNWLTDELKDLKTKVETSQQEEVDYQRQKGILGIDDKQNIVTSKLDELNRELTAAETDRLQKLAIYLSALSNGAALLPGVSDSAVIQHLSQQQSEIKRQYAQATTQLGPAHPKVLELKNELNQVSSALDDEINKVAERARTAYQIALKREQMLRAALEAQKEEANRLNESAIQYNILRHDLQSNQQLYDGLLQKLKEAGVAAGLRSTNVRVIDYARVPIKPSKPNIRLNLAVSLLLGCLGGALLAFVLEKLDDRLRMPDDIQPISGLPLIAVIPALKPENRSPIRGRLLPLISFATNGCHEKAELMAYSQPRSVFAESFRGLRTSLLLTGPAPPKVILITSPLPSEGKTTISVNSAIVLAQKGARVLLIDGYLRIPKIHQVFGLPSGSGLSTLLSGSDSVPAMDVIVQSAQLPTLFVLPSGPIPNQPAELLSSPQMKELVSRWRSQFDHIVIDSAPVLSATDSVVLSVEADSVILAVRWGQTSKTALVRAREVLLGVGARLTGVVMNAIELRELGLNYDAYYGYAYYSSK